MESDEVVASRSRACDLLDQRIALNRSGQKTDLVEWIFDRLAVPAAGTVLELCAGTGQQTCELLKRAGPSGHVLALDISSASLDRLREKAERASRGRLTTVPAALDGLPVALDSAGVSRRSLDLVFCAYGLYYAKDPIAVLASAAEFLRPSGRIVIVGPFGPNNHQLFSVLSACSVTVSDYVLYTSQQFMEAVVIPWATRHFRRLYVSTLANSVSWRTTSEVMAYWKSSTFYDASREGEVQAAFDDHFRGNATFVNEKWIMMVEMADARG